MRGRALASRSFFLSSPLRILLHLRHAEKGLVIDTGWAALGLFVVAPGAFCAGTSTKKHFTVSCLYIYFCLALLKLLKLAWLHLHV